MSTASLVCMAYDMADNFRGVLIFVEKTLRINFHVFKFRDINPVQGCSAVQTMMYTITVHCYLCQLKPHRLRYRV